MATQHRHGTLLRPSVGPFYPNLVNATEHISSENLPGPSGSAFLEVRDFYSSIRQALYRACRTDRSVS